MSGKATAVFWLGLILIFLNFWISGQSTSLWTSIAVPGSGGTPTGNSSGGTSQVPKLPGPLPGVAGRGR
jgi:hypothetical protein